MDIWTKKFWKAATERALRAGSATLASTYAVGDRAMDKINMDWVTAGNLFLGGAVVSFVIAMTAGQITGTGPSIGGSESLSPDEGEGG